MTTNTNFPNPPDNPKKKKTHTAFKWLVIGLLIIATLITGSGYWLLNTQQGFQWLLSTAARMSDEVLTIEGVDGTISDLQIDRLHFHDKKMQLALHRFQLDWSPAQLFSGKLQINTINARLIEIHSAASEEEDEDEEAMVLPDSLTSPIDLSLKNLQIDAINFYTIDASQSTDQSDKQSKAQPDFSITHLSTRLESNSHHYQLKHLSFNSMLGALKAAGEIETEHPFKLESDIHLDNSENWGTTQVNLTGTLEQLEVLLTHDKASMHGAIQAQLHPFADHPLTMLSALNATITDFNPAVFFPEDNQVPKANLALQATLNQDSKNQLSGNWSLKNHAVATLDQDGLPLAAFDTAILLTEDQLKLHDLQLLLAEKGALSGDVSWHFEQASGLVDLNVSHLNPAAIDTQLQAANIGGLIHLQGDADHQQINIDLSDGDLKLMAAVSRSDHQILLERIDLSHGQSRLTGQGELNLEEAVQNGQDIAGKSQPFQFTGQLAKFNIADFVKAPESDLNTRLSITGNLSPELTGTLDYRFEKSHLNNQLVTGQGKVSFAQPLSISSKAHFQIGANRLNMHGKFGKPGDTLSLNITAPALAQTGLGLSGYLQTHIDLRDTLDSPAIDFDIDSEKLTLPDNQSIDNLSAQGKLHEETLSLMLTANRFRSNEQTQIKQLNLKIAGKQSNHTIQTDLRIDDELTVTLQADGGIYGLGEAESIDNNGTSPGWDGLLTHLSVTGQIPVQLLSPTPVKLSSEEISLQDAQLTIAGGRAAIQNVFWSPDHWESAGNFSGIALHPDSDLIPKEKILRLGGKWDVQSRGGLNGTVEIVREDGDWYLPGEPPEAAGIQTLKLHANARDGQLTAQFDLISTLIGEISASIILPVSDSENNDFFPPNTRLDGQLSLKLPDLSWIEYLTEDAIQTNGQVELQARVAGTVDKPQLQGDIRGNDLAVSLLEHGLQLHQGQLAARFDESALHIDQFSFVSPYVSPPKDSLLKKLQLEEKPGTLEMTGSLGYKEGTHNLTVTLDQLYLANPPHYWMVLSGQSSAKFVNNVLDLGGEINADAGLISQPPVSRPQLADDIIIQDDQAIETDTKTDEEAPIINLHATLDLGRYFYIRAAGLEGRLDGNLRIQNDEEQAVSVVGSIATRKATFTAYGQNLTVERGIVNFNGPIDDPGLNVRAVRKGLEVEAGVEVAGSVLNPRIKLISTPNVPDTDKLSWIVLGRSPDSSGVDTSLLLTAATSIFGGQSGGGLTGQLKDTLGVDEVSFRQGPGASSNPLANQIGTIGKRISSRAYLSYERGITATTAGITKLTYSLTPRISVVTQAGEDSAIDLFYTFRFD